VRLVSATVYALRIPFLEPVRHSLAGRAWSDSVVVRVRDADGAEGFGEAAPRPYVTGETPATVLEHVAAVLWPAVRGIVAPELRGPADLDAVARLVPDGDLAAGRHPAARAALELAIVDWALRRQGASAAALLPPRRSHVVYAGAITAESPVQAARQARWARLVGLQQVKVKVGIGDDVGRVGAVREVLGSGVGLQVDANGAWTPVQALAAMHRLAACGVATVEQPIPPGAPSALARLRAESPLPLVADESVVTLGDVDALVAAGAVDGVNVRVSKCGGLARSVTIARRAAAAGLEVQVGSHVGETAILAAVGRHLAAGLERLALVEGSYGTLLLTEDVSDDGLRFGHRGEAPLLTGPGWGVHVRVDRLRRYAQAVVELAA
jgi:L-alanine-DL-glutamate epimerase-like enolase superfamily enzyme